jgi:hypothetical protein
MSWRGGDSRRNPPRRAGLQSQRLVVPSPEPRQQTLQACTHTHARTHTAQGHTAPSHLHDAHAASKRPAAAVGCCRGLHTHPRAGAGGGGRKAPPVAAEAGRASFRRVGVGGPGLQGRRGGPSSERSRRLARGPGQRRDVGMHHARKGWGAGKGQRRGKSRRRGAAPAVGIWALRRRRYGPLAGRQNGRRALLQRTGVPSGPLRGRLGRACTRFRAGSVAPARGGRGERARRGDGEGQRSLAKPAKGGEPGRESGDRGGAHGPPTARGLGGAR